MSEPPSATVADAAATPTADPRALSPGTSRLLWSTFLGLGLAAVIALIPLPYAVLRPGPATNTLGVDASGKPLIEVPDATTYPTTGSLDFTTVRVSGGPGRRVNAWDLLGAWLDPDDDIFRERLLFPEGSTSEQVQERNQEEMVNSQQEAAVVALRSLGKDVGRRFVVGSLADDAPARSVIKVGDAITAVDGRVVTSIEQIQLGITAHPPGESVDLTIERGGREQDVQAKTTEVDGAQGGANWVDNVNFGGRTEATIAVTPGETLTVFVGEQPTSLAGGFNGGGAGETGGRGGGGASDIRRGGIALTDRVVVAGGGGGAGFWSNLHVIGGVGGGLQGADGSRNGTDPGGVGATQSAPGPYGTCASLMNPVTAGAFGVGGAPSGCGCEGYGGGGGWYGGAGSGNCRGGGGGSGYVDPVGSTNVVLTAGGAAPGNGSVTIRYE